MKMSLRRIAVRLLPPVAVERIGRLRDERLLRRFLRKGRTPWAPGYGAYSSRLIASIINDEATLRVFSRGEPLPLGYGVGVDERCVEIPWLVSHLKQGAETLLDAGSALNHDFVLGHPVFREKNLHILTLAPEGTAFWSRGISYIFADLRDIPVRDAYYDTVVCVSTLEHVGFDNTFFTGREEHREDRRDDFLVAVDERRRVLKPGGVLLLTVPFGVYQDHAAFQQFDASLLERTVKRFGPAELVHAFYAYTGDGWQLAEEADCAACEYVEWVAAVWAGRRKFAEPYPIEQDLAAAARGVVCVRLVKAS